MKSHVSFTLRLDRGLYDRVKVISRRERQSITAFVKEALAKRLREEDAAALFDAFSIVGEDLSEANVEYGREAQREVVLKGE